MVSVNPNPNPTQTFYFFDPSNMALPGVNNLPPPTTAAVSTTSDDPNKKIRKPYTITKSRENWTDQEHDKFLEALQLFDRDWKKIEAFVGSKTVIQIRSHAQKYFLKVQKSGTSEHLPPPRPKRKASHPYPQKAPKNTPTASQNTGPSHSSPAFVDPAYIYSTDSSSVLGTPINSVPLSSWNYDATPPVSVPKLTAVDTRWTGSGQAAPLNCCHSTSNESTHLALPSSKAVNQGNHAKPVKVMPDFAQVYCFIGSVFDPNSTNHLQRLKQMDPINVETALLLMRNISINLTSPEFEDHKKLLSSYDPHCEKAKFANPGSKSMTVKSENVVLSA